MAARHPGRFAALHLRLADPVHLAHAAAARRRGAPRLPRVLALADGRSESPWETVIREFHRVVEAPGWVRRGYTSRDLLRDTRDLLADVDRTLGRTHAPRRLDAWHAVVRTSALTAAGRSRLAGRLCR
ncbi:hypothetical protein IEQ44_14150 [Nocardioides sp. Y6]|uniref:Uncharacterized protein n=1 Tax=Nocardioides malaquae TaxID=2773426 RepID=A0ABR9RW45_9ACTN|nr:hypothetical protein [Nocardioides malaquae]MBE7325791.1 hypothetical protein [Nocardioides malaquae]